MASSWYITQNHFPNQFPNEDFESEKDASDYETASETTSTYSIIDRCCEYGALDTSDPPKYDQDSEVNLSGKSNERTWADLWYRITGGSSEDEQHQCGTGEDILNQLLAILDDPKRYRSTLKSMAESGRALKILDLLQAVLDAPECTDNTSRNKLIVAMQRLSRITELYPSSYELGPIKYNHEKDYLGRGRFSDVYKTCYAETQVCMKVIKPVSVQPPELLVLKRKFAWEAILWRQLSHENVMPFFGMCKTSNWPCFVSPWMENGTVTEFLKRKPESDRYLLVTDITSGLKYLHSIQIIHGDLKGANILVDASERARLADFGISSVLDPNIPEWSSQSAPASRGGTRRWQAPEVIEQESYETEGDTDKGGCNTMPSDIYAWSCVCYEIYTGKLPFYEIKRNETVFCEVLKGAMPSYPSRDTNAWTSWGLTDEFWNLMLRCWSWNPEDRPTVDDLVARLDDKREDNRQPPPVYQHPTSKRYWGWTSYSPKPRSLLRSLLKIHKILHKAGLFDSAGSTVPQTRGNGNEDSTDENTSEI